MSLTLITMYAEEDTSDITIPSGNIHGDQDTIFFLLIFSQYLYRRMHTPSFMPSP
jgi:hypothetical protein